MKNENDILQPHRKRTLRAFLAKREETAPEVGALWAVLYGYTVVDHATALAVAVECCDSSRTVGDVLDGWRPAALTEPAVPVFGAPNPNDDDDMTPVPCGDCGHVHGPDDDCPYVADPATCECGADHRREFDP